MKRTILSKIALAVGVITIGLAGVGQAQAHGTDPTHTVDTYCGSSSIEVAGLGSLGGYHMAFLMKAFPPNWIYTGVSTAWTRTPTTDARNNPAAVPFPHATARFMNLEPGYYFVWVLFASPNGSGGYSYHYHASTACTVKGSVFAGPGAAKASKKKRAALAKPAPRVPNTPPARIAARG
jgi:hypothetical protein